MTKIIENNLSVFASTVTDDSVITSKDIQGDPDNVPIIKVNNLEQVGMIVQNLNQAISNMWKNFGIGPWNVHLFTPDRLSDAMYYNKPSVSGMNIGFCQVGKIQLELIEPIGNDNIYRDFANEYGNGVQHLGWYKVTNKKDFFTAIEKLEVAGFSCIWRGRSPHAYFAYFDTIRAFNTILEVVLIDNADIKPDYIYPEKKS